MSTLTEIAKSTDLSSVSEFSRFINKNQDNKCPFGVVCPSYTQEGCDSLLTKHRDCGEWTVQVEANINMMAQNKFHRQEVSEEEIRPGHPVLFICPTCGKMAMLADQGQSNWQNIKTFTNGLGEEGLWEKYEPVWAPMLICTNCKSK